MLKKNGQPKLHVLRELYAPPFKQLGRWQPMELFDHHSRDKHGGSIPTCRQRAGDGAVATDVVER